MRCSSRAKLHLRTSTFSCSHTCLLGTDIGPAGLRGMFHSFANLVRSKQASVVDHSFETRALGLSMIQGKRFSSGIICAKLTFRETEIV